MKDAVDKIIDQWKNQNIKEDLTPMETLGRIARLNALIGKKLEDNFSSFDLTRWEFDVLATLRRSGEPYVLTPTQLFDTLMVTSGTMTNRLTRLENRKLISRPKNEQDKRSTLVQLTTDGLDIVNRCLKAHIETETAITSVLGKKTQKELNRILKEFEAAL